MGITWKARTAALAAAVLVATATTAATTEMATAGTSTTSSVTHAQATGADGAVLAPHKRKKRKVVRKVRKCRRVGHRRVCTVTTYTTTYGTSTSTGTVTVPGAPATPVTGRWSGALNTADQSQVNNAYWSEYDSGTSVPTGYTGNDSTCTAGTTSAASQAATLRAINFVRSLGGLSPVSFDAGLNAAAQQSALMMSAQGALDHHPSTSFRCYTPLGADTAGKSNLALAYPSITSAGVVGMYMTEPGANNTAVGHRRWLMNPVAGVMGTGSTNTANAIQVMGPTNAAAANPAYVSWPTAGAFPTPLEPGGRWSLSAGNASTSFAGASVQVTHNGSPVAVTKEAVANGYARPTLVWEMPGGSNSGSYHVSVTGITGGSSSSYDYDVNFFAPTH